MNEPKKSKNITYRVILPKEWKKIDITKDPAINIIKNHTVSNKIEQLEKYIEVKEQECDELQEVIDKAIEYIKEQTKGYQDNFDRVEEESWLYDLKITLNILQGDNK